ncbi:MAG: hypothetical protein AAGA10_30800, partial [Bacteroidota bacterium]
YLTPNPFWYHDVQLNPKEYELASLNGAFTTDYGPPTTQLFTSPNPYSTLTLPDLFMSDAEKTRTCNLNYRLFSYPTLQP